MYYHSAYGWTLACGKFGANSYFPTLAKAKKALIAEMPNILAKRNQSADPARFMIAYEKTNIIQRSYTEFQVATK